MAGRERGAASLTIALSDSIITVEHGEAGIVLARKHAQQGDWDRLWLFLTEVLGLERTEAGRGGP